MVMLTAVSADAQSKGTKRSGTKAQTTQHKGGGNRSGKKRCSRFSRSGYLPSTS